MLIMRIFRLLVASLGTYVVAILSGCRAPESHTITVIPRDTTEAFSVMEHAGVAEAARKFKVGIYWNGSSAEDEVEQQVALSERAIHDGDLGLVLSPASPFALNTVIRRALSNGMPVVILGAPISLTPSQDLSFVLSDVGRAGVLVAQRLNEVLDGHGDIAIVGADPTSPGSVERANAIRNSLLQIAPRIRTVDRLAGSRSIGQTEVAAENALLAHPGLSAIVALDSTSTLAVVAAVRATRSKNRVRIIGCDPGLYLLFLLRHGALDAIVLPDMRDMGAQAVSNIMARRAGKQIQTSTYFQPVLLTRSNIDDENIQQMMLMDWRLKP